MATTSSLSPKWLESTKGKIAGTTAVIAAAAGLINGGIDLYKVILKVPNNVYDRTNDELFKKHFNTTPLVSQPVQIKASSISVEMLLQVYESGDIFVRYGDLQQWLPFRKPRVASFSLFSEAMAQTAASGPSIGWLKGQQVPSEIQWQRVEQLKVPLVIDIDKIIKDATPVNNSSASDKWTKAFLISEIQQDRAAFSPTTKTYQKIFTADPGFKFTKVDLDLGSANKANVRNVKIIDGGKSLQVEYSLTSGPIFDQYRGWIHATVKTEQEKIK